MKQTLPREALQASSTLVSERLGLHFPEPRWGDLSRGLEKAARGLGLPDPAALVARLVAGPLDDRQAEVLASFLTVGETYLFRDPRCFEALEHDILPPLFARARWRRVRIWSVGCSTGEEPYSLALLLDRLLPDLDDWHVTILATDLNVRSLAAAQAGVYSRWSFRQVAPEALGAWFTERGRNQYELCERIRRKVTFAYLNLAADPYPSLVNNTAGMDVILCRNVLMYFEADRAARVVSNLRRCLADGGTLILGPAELHLGHQVGLRGVQLRGATCFVDAPPRRPAGGAPAVEPTARPSPPEEWAVPSRPASPPGPAGDAAQWSEPKSSNGAAWSAPRPPRPPLPPLPPLPSWPRPSSPRAAHGEASPKPQATPKPPAPPTSFSSEGGQQPGKAAPSTSPAAGVPDAEDRARQLHEAGRDREAIDVLHGLLGEDPTIATGATYAGAMLLLARALANLGRLGEALGWCDRAILVDKMRPTPHLLRATVLQERDELDEATASLRRALYLDADSPVAHFAMASLARRCGRPAEARRHLGQVRALLGGVEAGTVLPELEGLEASRLVQIVDSMLTEGGDAP